jgi:hypothetical protein
LLSCAEFILARTGELIGIFMWFDLFELYGFWLDRVLWLPGNWSLRPSDFARAYGSAVRRFQRRVLEAKPEGLAYLEAVRSSR